MNRQHNHLKVCFHFFFYVAYVYPVWDSKEIICLLYVILNGNHKLPFAAGKWNLFVVTGSQALSNLPWIHLLTYKANQYVFFQIIFCPIYGYVATAKSRWRPDDNCQDAIADQTKEA